MPVVLGMILLLVTMRPPAPAIKAMSVLALVEMANAALVTGRAMLITVPFTGTVPSMV